MADKIEELLLDETLTEDQKMALKTVAARADDYSLEELGSQLKAHNVRRYCIACFQSAQVIQL